MNQLTSAETHSLDDWNIDRFLLGVIPAVALALTLAMPAEWLLQSLLLCVSIYFYIITTYKYRFMYGFSGIRGISVPSTVIATYTVFISVPSVYVMMIREHWNEPAYFYSILLFYYLYPLGLFLGQRYKKINPEKVQNFFRGGLKTEKGDESFYEFAVVMLSFCGLILAGYLLRANELPLIEIIKNPGGNAKYALLREGALKTLQMSFIEKYFFHWLRSLFLPLGIIISLYLASYYKKYKYKTLFVVYFTMGIFVNGLTLEKSPIAAIFLSIAAFVLMKREIIKPGLLFSLLVLILSGPILISFFLFVDRPDVFEVLLWSYINRILVTPAEVLYYYFQYFPEKHDFLLGQATQLFAWMSSDGLFNVSNYVAKIWWNNPETTGSANAHYLGLYWASFGWWGTTLATVFFGFITHLFYWKIVEVSEYKKNLIYLVSMAIALPNFTFGFFSSNFTILFFTKGLVVLIVLLMLYDYSKKYSVFSRSTVRAESLM